LNTISDITAFAAEHPDYWTDFRTDAELPDDLSDAIREAVDAAREHVRTIVIALLQRAGALLPTLAGDPPVKPKRFNHGPTSRNWHIEFPAPAGTGHRLYGIAFLLRRFRDTGPIALFGVLQAKKREGITPIVNSLRADKQRYDENGYHIWVPGGAALTEGRPIDEVALEAAGHARMLLDRVPARPTT
jgi:hypothetical protein